MKILIIDDSKTVRAVLNRVLSDGGYTDILFCNSASEAYDIFLKPENEFNDTDLIILDIHMPGMDGIEFTREIKKIDKYNDIPIIIVTSSDMASSMEKVFEAGANDFIKKPFLVVELLARVKSLLKLKSETDKRKEREIELIDRERELIEVNRFLEIVNQNYLKSMAIDGLTGITNRKYFNESIDMEWRKALRKKTPIAIIMMDVDYFKKYNDNYGHQKGDDCLITVANGLKQSLELPSDMVARYGGEEFVILLPDSDINRAIEMGEKARERVENLNIKHEHSSVTDHVTISCGVASIIPGEMESYEGLIKIADDSLYLAKEKGRNRVVSLDFEERT